MDVARWRKTYRDARDGARSDDASSVSLSVSAEELAALVRSVPSVAARRRDDGEDFANQLVCAPARRTGRGATRTGDISVVARIVFMAGEVVKDEQVAR